MPAVKKMKSRKYASPSVVLQRLNENPDTEDESDSECCSNASGGIQGADFETAVAATGYGKFNYLLLLGFFLPCWASIFDVSNMSMILPSAECDLGLSMFQKGVLNASTYAGTITTAMLWGFLADVYGRRKLLIYGFLADSLCNILSGTAQNIWFLLFFKYCSGCIMNGPYAISMSYCAEFHGGKERGRVLLYLGLFSAIGNIAVPVLAWLVIPQTWEIVLFDGLFVYNSWRLFLTLCGAPTLVGFVALIFFPESPKFLMSQGRNDEALEIFKKMYTMNTGNSSDQYPIESLENGINISGSKKSLRSVSSKNGTECKNVLQGLADGFKQMKPLFFMPHLLRLLLVVSIQFGGMLSLNTIRLWLPQIFAMLESFDQSGYDKIQLQDGPPTFCEILDFSMTKATNVSLNSTNISQVQNCDNVTVNSTVYLNTLIICLVSTVGFIFISFLLNIFGQKNILLLCYVIPLICAASLNWSANAVLTLVLACVYIALTNISVNAVIAITVDLFPTTLRTMAVSLIMMLGRVGSLTGNLLFSVLLLQGCVAPLMAIAGLLLVCTVLTFLVPKSTGALE
ncbi:synaptic vesicle glycoprotein 2B-like isoform X2 [Athalia rosae]|uniref:synaptic vesicle glycoprotein 2B-like isoform X2 n=1 Tax=Athalia rosae TaxID=37344 RepID=UPI00203465F6|nr:synaptic vesicle glycoprotein 2B-like isoform X2 [Athalia rosae]